MSGSQELENQLSLMNDSSVDLWATSVTIGLSVSSGNIDSSLIYADIQTKRGWNQNEVLMGLGGTYSESEEVTTSDYQFAYLQYNRLLTDRFYFGAKGYGLRDDLADLDYRLHLGPLWGYYFIKNDRTTLTIEAGPNYTWEKLGGVKDSYVSVAFTERFDHKFNDRLKMWQLLEFRPQIDDFNRYTLVAELGLEARMTDNLSLKTFARNLHDSAPAPGRERNDLAFVTALSYSFGGDPLELDGTKRLADSENLKDLAGATEGNVTTAALGVSMNSGNTDSLTITADLLGSRRYGDEEFLFGASGTYGEFDNGAGTSVTDQNIYAMAQYNYLFADPWYFGVHSDLYHDKLSDLSYRWTTGPVLGVYAIRDADTTLSFEAGPAYVREEKADVTTDSLAAYAAQRFTHRFNDSLHVWQSVSFNSPFNDFDDYVLRAEVGGAIALGGGFSWRTSLEDTYTNLPAGGRERNDLRLKSSIGFSF